MKITIYELLEMIKNGKLKDETKIRCSDFPAIYVYKNGTLGFYGKDEFIELTLRDILENINYANYEIIEEEKKIPEKINKNYNIRILDLDKPYTIKDYDMEQLIEMVQDIYEKQDDIIDYLKSKGE